MKLIPFSDKLAARCIESRKFELPPSMMTSPFDKPGSSCAIVSSTGLPAGTMIQTMRGAFSFGGTSVMVFAMELMGAAEVRNYYLSWAEWGNAEDTPVVVPKK